MKEATRPMPLSGKRIVVTRARAASDTFSAHLRDRGAIPVVVPTIEVHPPTDPTGMVEAASRVERFDWVVFTSANGVEGFVAEVRRQGRSAEVFARAKIAVVGPGTASALERAGLAAELVAQDHRGEGLAEALTARFADEVPRPKVLLARAEVARDVVPDALRAIGCEVLVAAVYATRSPPPESFDALLAMLEEARIDAVAFTSSSTVVNLCEAFGGRAPRLLEGVVVATIGPPTSATARSRGVRVDVEARTSTMTGLVEALEAHFADRPPSGKTS